MWKANAGATAPGTGLWHVGLIGLSAYTLGLAAEVEDLCNPAREHGLVSMAVAQERIHANAAHLRVLHPRSACCVLRFGAACSVVLNVMSYVGLRQHSRVSKRNDTCRNKWRRWCAGRA